VNLLNQSFSILTKFDKNILKTIESIGRICYKSENKITEDSDIAFAKKIIKNGHESVIEHISVTVKFICDRGISHELVRHRLSSFSQESTRYVDYLKGGLAFIIPLWINIKPGKYGSMEDVYESNGSHIGEDVHEWLSHLFEVESSYESLREQKWSPQEARSILPNCLKTELFMTANLREWRHVIKMRTAKGAHPQVVELITSLHNELKSKIPILFDF
jgi:thymidylate synthase (FAD)